MPAPAHIWDVTVQASEFACFLVSFVREWILAYARSHIHGYSVHLYDTNNIKRTSNNLNAARKKDVAHITTTTQTYIYIYIL